MPSPEVSRNPPAPPSQGGVITSSVSHQARAEFAVYVLFPNRLNSGKFISQKIQHRTTNEISRDFSFQLDRTSR